MPDLFKSLSAGLLGGLQQTKDTPQAILRMGGIIMPYPMIDISQGTQPSRLQIDLSLDGTQHIAGSTTGLGTYQMQFMDCPVVFTREVTSTVGETQMHQAMLTHYLGQTTVTDRFIEVTLFSNGARATNCNIPGLSWLPESNSPVAVFRGIGTDILLTLTPPEDQSTTAYLRTQLNAKGLWTVE